MKNLMCIAGLTGLLALTGCSSTATREASRAEVVNTVTLEISGMT